MPARDDEAWSNLEKLFTEDAEVKEEMEKKHYILTDLLLLNFIRSKAIELGEDEEDARKIAQKMWQDPGNKHLEDVEKIYPREIWSNRISRRNFNVQDFYYPSKKKAEQKKAPKKDSKLGGLIRKTDKNDGDEGNRYGDQAKAWMECLDDWCRFSKDLGRNEVKIKDSPPLKEDE